MATVEGVVIPNDEDEAAELHAQAEGEREALHGPRLVGDDDDDGGDSE